MKTGAIGFSALALMTGWGLTANASVYYTVGGTQDLQMFNVSFNGAGSSVYAGGIQISQPNNASYPDNSGMPQTYLTVCTDFEGSLYEGRTYEYNSPASYFAGLTGIDPLWNNGSLAIQNAAYLFYHYGNASASSGISGSVQNLAALQLAVWMALYDTTASGNIVVNGASEFYVKDANNVGNDTGAIDLALSWITGLTGDTSYSGSLLTPISSLGDQGNPNCQLPQELLMASGPQPNGSGSAVPEPSTIMAGALLLVPLSASLIRWGRKVSRKEDAA
jgi:hypothetical protein